MNDNLYIHQIGMDPYYKTWHASGRSMIMYMHTDGGSIVSTQQNYPIRKGTLCFIGGNHFHYTLPEEPETYTRSKLFLPTDVLDKLLLMFPEELQMRDVFSPNALVYTQLEAADQQYVEQLCFKNGAECTSFKYEYIIAAYPPNGSPLHQQEKAKA